MLKELRRKHALRVRLLEISFGLLLSVLASLALYKFTNYVGRPAVTPYVSSSNKHAAAVSPKTSDDRHTPSPIDQTVAPSNGSTLPIATSKDTHTVLLPTAAEKNPLLSVSAATPVLDIGPLAVANPVKTEVLPLCKLQLGVNLGPVSVNTGKCK